MILAPRNAAFLMLIGVTQALESSCGPTSAPASRQQGPADPEIERIAWIAVSPDDAHVAVVLASRSGQRSPGSGIYVVSPGTRANLRLDLGDVMATGPIGWRDDQGGPELYVTALLAGGETRIFRAKDDLTSVVLDLPDGALPMPPVAAWSPNGDMMAFAVFAGISSYSLAFLKESTFLPTEITLSDKRIAWADERTLFVARQGSAGSELVQLLVDRLTPREEEVWLTGDQVRVCGTVGRTPVAIREERQVYLGRALVAADALNAMAGGPYIFVNNEEGIRVFDENGSLIGQKHGHRLLPRAFSAHRNELFVITNDNTRIERLSVPALAEVGVVYQIGD